VLFCFRLCNVKILSNIMIHREATDNAKTFSKGR
jgi:hypothetical protein